MLGSRLHSIMVSLPKTQIRFMVPTLSRVLNAALPEVGTPHHLAMRRFTGSTGVFAIHLPERSTGLAVIALLFKVQDIKAD